MEIVTAVGNHSDRKLSKDRSGFASSSRSALALEEKRKNTHVIRTKIRRGNRTEKTENKHDPETLIAKNKSLKV